MDAQRCEQCGFTYELDEATRAAAWIADRSAELATLVLGDGPQAQVRRDPVVWSPLEYACPVRDMLRVQRERVLAARRRERSLRWLAVHTANEVRHHTYDVRRQLA